MAAQQSTTSTTPPAAAARSRRLIWWPAVAQMHCCEWSERAVLMRNKRINFHDGFSMRLLPRAAAPRPPTPDHAPRGRRCLNGGCSSMAVFRRNLSFSSRSFCAAAGTVDVTADENAVCVEREHSMASFACIVLSIGTFTM